MNVICPLCKGPATQPIMDIYCKAECNRPASKDKATTSLNSGTGNMYIIPGHGTFVVFTDTRPKKGQYPPGTMIDYIKNEPQHIISNLQDLKLFGNPAPVDEQRDYSPNPYWYLVIYQ
jgi:hypothetical protein